MLTTFIALGSQIGLHEGTSINITPIASGLIGAVIVAILTLNIRIVSLPTKLTYTLSAVLTVLLLLTNSSALVYVLCALMLLPIYLAVINQQNTLIVCHCLSTVLMVVQLLLVLWLDLPYYYFAIGVLLWFFALMFIELTPQSTMDVVPGGAIDSHTELGLPDTEALRDAYMQYDRTAATSILVLIRLEGFIQVNQHLGREFGDLLLTQSANRIAECVQLMDVMPIGSGRYINRVAHLGGLQFAFICSLIQSRHFHKQLIEEIIAKTRTPFNVGNCTIEISARASYVNCEEESGELDALLACAYLALDHYPNRTISPYQHKMRIEWLAQQERLSELTKVKFHQDFAVYFQPVIRHSDQGVEFVELLLRWHHPTQGLLSAAEFIADLKLVGSAIPVAEFVFERACELAMALRVEDLITPISINIFGPELLNEAFIEFVDTKLHEHQLDPGDIIIEYPSSLIAEISPESVAMMSRLKRLGVGLCADRFGEAPLVLAKVPELRFDYIKLAASMTSSPERVEAVKEVVQGVVEVHLRHGCEVIGECIETPQQLAFAKSLGTTAAQGNLHCEPKSSDKLISWIKSQQRVD
ncbi:EAL domain-containing protein [Pseudoalteromonas sp. T1lg65]|uniref:EAL domain-containing protein n=1 Tax=Pseudoalteromonas sp. T1lg65 TaxID=2077101 RepID=UPI003F78D1A3